MRLKVLLVANGYPPNAVGGVEVYTAGLVQALAARGHTVSVVCRDARPEVADYEVISEEDRSAPIFRLVNNYRQLHSFAEIFADGRIDRVFDRLLDRLQPDLIHFNHLVALSATMPMLAVERGIPCLFTAHDFWALCQRIYLHDWLKRACPGPVCGGDCYTCITSPTPAKHARTIAVSTLRRIIPFPIRTRLRRLLTKDDYFLPDMQATRPVLDERYELFRRALQATGRIVVPSGFVKRTLVQNGYDADHIEVLPLGMAIPDARPAQSTPHRPLRLAFVGSILPWKGVETLVNAFLSARSPDLTLTFYGREDIIPAFSRSLRGLAQGDDRITFAGPFQPGEKDAAYDALDVLVIPSLAHESFSLVAREALLRGKPVIASDIGALPEVIRDGVNGFLFPPGDADALTALFERLAEQPDRLAQLMLPGPFPILSIDEHVDRLVGIYRACQPSA